MNERIAKLYDQAIVVKDGGDFVTGELDPEKFAELIVRECARLPFKDTGEVTTDGEIAVSEFILKHFGVEE